MRTVRMPNAHTATNMKNGYELRVLYTQPIVKVSQRNQLMYILAHSDKKIFDKYAI